MELPINYNKSHWTIRKQAREQYVKEQNGLCWFCKEPLCGEPKSDVNNLSINIKLFPVNFFDYPVHLHHCHKTKMTIGAVHAKCNAVLWQYHGE